MIRNRSFLLLLAVAACGEEGSLGLAGAALAIVAPSADGVSNDLDARIAWTALPGAEAYDVTLYLDAAATIPGESVRTGQVTETRFPLPDGAVRWAVVEALGPFGVAFARTPPLRFLVRALPGEFPRFTAVRHDPSRMQGGYFLFNILDLAPPTPDRRVTGFGLANVHGEVVWFSTRFAEDIRLLPNGNFLLNTRFAGESHQRAVEMTPDGAIVWQSRDGVFPHHEVGIGPDGHVLYLLYTHKDVGGEIYEGDGLELVEQSTGSVLWSWNIFDHLSTDEIDPIDIATPGRSGSGWDWTHSNAAVWDPARSLVWVSVRSLDRILGVDYPSGNVRVTLGEGGLGGEGLVSHQHAPSIDPDGSILVFDNGNRRTPSFTRVVRLLWDETAGTVAETFEWREAPDFFDPAVGDVDRLPNGNILVTSGARSRLVEITPAGESVWEMSQPNARFWFYRSERIDAAQIPPGVLPFD